jgi:hypothetical protein
MLNIAIYFNVMIAYIIVRRAAKYIFSPETKNNTKNTPNNHPPPNKQSNK